MSDCFRMKMARVSLVRCTLKVLQVSLHIFFAIAIASARSQLHTDSNSYLAVISHGPSTIRKRSKYHCSISVASASTKIDQSKKSLSKFHDLACCNINPSTIKMSGDSPPALPWHNIVTMSRPAHPLDFLSHW